MTDLPLPRAAAATLRQHLRVMPAVVLTGARQTGKSTLARQVDGGRRQLHAFDEPEVLDEARRRPDALLSDSTPVTLDEVQRVPDFLPAVKRSIDRDRRPGRFLLTASVDLLSMRQVSESLAGRASYLDLWPMTHREQRGEGRCGAWDELVRAEDGDWPEVLAPASNPGTDWRTLARRGGFPVPAIHEKTDSDRALWFDGYLRHYLERDLLRLSTISAVPDFHRLMTVSSRRTGQLLHQTELGRDAEIPQPTTRRYLGLLETSHLIARLPAFTRNPTKRLIKSPKLYWCDTGLALHLAGGPEPTGPHLENLVFRELRSWAGVSSRRVGIFHWRTTVGEEVDFVIESDRRLLPVEVKATAHPRLRDARGLLAFRDAYRESARAGLLLHTGNELRWLSGEVLAAPWWTVI